jgi:hypothetical protein
MSCPHPVLALWRRSLLPAPSTSALLCPQIPHNVSAPLHLCPLPNDAGTFCHVRRMSPDRGCRWVCRCPWPSVLLSCASWAMRRPGCCNVDERHPRSLDDWVLSLCQSTQVPPAPASSQPSPSARAQPLSLFRSTTWSRRVTLSPLILCAHTNKPPLDTITCNALNTPLLSFHTTLHTLSQHHPPPLAIHPALRRPDTPTPCARADSGAPSSAARRSGRASPQTARSCQTGCRGHR